MSWYYADMAPETILQDCGLDYSKTTCTNDLHLCQVEWTSISAHLQAHFD